MINWVKRNKLASVLVLIVVFLLVKPYLVQPVLRETSYSEYAGAPGVTTKSLNLIPQQDYTPSDSGDRLVVQESKMSLVVKDVRQSVNEILDYTKKVDGYMVSSSLSSPQEAPFATVVLRIPAKQLETALENFRSVAFKVSSEYLMGTDVTDEYTDIDARLLTLNKTKTKFEEIMNQATKVQDILEVQREIINLQGQIDSLKGRQQYLEKTAAMAKITLYLSADEFSLPYAPAESFRPGVVFKYAVRSLVKSLRAVAKALIWVGVYSVVWIPVLLAIVFFRRRQKRLQKQ